MPITPAQRSRRRAYLGASDTPAILGLLPWVSPADIYYSKVYEMPPETSESPETGTWIEPILVQWAADEMGVKLRAGNTFRVAKVGPGKGLFSTHLDGVVVDHPWGIEAKYASTAQKDDWGPDGTDDIPVHVLAQVQHQMYAADLERVYVSVAIASFGLQRRLYRIDRNDKAIKLIAERGVEWWEKHVEARVVPGPGASIPMGLLKAIQREPGSTVKLTEQDAEELAHYLAVKDARKAQEHLEEESLAHLLARMGDAETAEFPDGTQFIYREEKGIWTCDRTKLWCEIPQSREYFTQTTRKVPRVKNVKALPQPKESTNVQEEGRETSRATAT